MLQYVHVQKEKKRAFRRHFDALEAEGNVHAIVEGMRAYNDAGVQE